MLSLLALLACGSDPPSSKGPPDPEPTPPVVDADQDGSPAGDDCDDLDPDRHPGATEVCDGDDEDCDQLVDGDDPDVPADGFLDLDGDGHGDPAAPRGCDGVALADDCDDTDPAAFPGALELCADAVDQNCNGLDAECHTAMDDVRTAGAADVRLEGLDADDHVGQAVVGAGDVDGDGWADFAVGRGWSTDGRSENEGRVWVVRGPLVDGASPIATVAHATLVGEVAEEGAGTTLAGGVDADGDGLHDLLLGAPGASSALVQVGAVYLVVGLGPGEAGLDAGAAAKVYGPVDHGGSLGTAIALPGDLDGDGEQEVVAGAPYATTGGAAFGEVFVWRASLRGEHDASFVARTTIHGDPGDELGGALASAGDTDGDGLPDLWATDQLHAYLFLGPLPTGVLATDAASAEITAGTRVAAPGDTDGDGVTDLWVGDPAGDAVGEARLFLGPFGPSIGRSSAVATVTGSVADGAFGTVAAAGDVDGDGLPDLLASAPTAGGGQAFVFLSSLSGERETIDADARLTADGPTDRLGTSLAGIGDLDQDGYDDVVVGVPDANGPAALGGVALGWYGGF